MGDAESALPSSKKRVAGRQLTKDNPEFDDDSPESEMGTFQKASDEVLATRRIVKVRRSQPTSDSSNPFAGIRLVPQSESTAKATSPPVQPDTPGDKTILEQKDDSKENHGKTGEATDSGDLADKHDGTEGSNRKLEQKTDVSAAKGDEEGKNDPVEEATQLVEAGKEVENGGSQTDKEAREAAAKEEQEDTEKGAGGEAGKAIEEAAEKEKLNNDKKDASKPAESFSSFKQLSSSQNAFTGLAGTGFGSSSFSFGSIAKEGTAFGASSGSVFGFKGENASYPSFSIGSSNNGSSSLQLFGNSAPDTTKSGASGIPSMQEVPIETGEENEKVVFTADAVLYEYLDGGWKERGKGELKVNTSISGDEKSRLVMRARGNYRLILNASIYPDMTLTNMDKKGVTFACANSAGEGKKGLSTFALKFKDSSFAEEFRGVVTAHKGKKATILKTPENSPKATDD